MNIARPLLYNLVTPDRVRRFFAKVRKTENGCWLWSAGKSYSGYGRFQVDGHSVKAHRFSFLIAHKKISPKLSLDHICRNHPCVNPSHLEEVPIKENILRGNGFCAVEARRTICKNGHPLTPENVRITKAGFRKCIPCLVQLQKKKNRLYRLRHYEKERQRERDKYKNNREKILAREKDRYKRNREQILARMRQKYHEGRVQCQPV